MSNSSWPPGLQHIRLPCPSPSSWVCSDSSSLSWWCYLTISSSAALFFCFQSFPASGSFPISPLFASGGQSIGVSALAPVLPMNIQGWFPLGLTFFSVHGTLMSLLQHHIWKYQFFGAQPSLWWNSHIRTWLLEKPITLICGICQQGDVSDS